MQSEMIRSVTPGHLWRLRRKAQYQMILPNECLLVQPYRPFWFAVRCAFQGSGPQREAMVYQDRNVLATVHARGVPDHPEQRILYFGFHGSDQQRSVYDLWFRLLERLCIHAGYHGIHRLHATVWSQQQAEIGEIFRQLGFQVYTHNLVLQLAEAKWHHEPTHYPMRAQSRHDAWAVHKLYGSVTPPLVQRAEARTPRAWLPTVSTGWQQVHGRSWVSGPEDHLNSYLRITSGPDAHVFSLLVHPETRDEVTEVVRFGLAQLSHARPVYFILREYHQELVEPLERLGFRCTGQQALLVKSVVVRVRRAPIAPALKASIWGSQVVVPRISTPREDVNTYVRATQADE